MSVSDEESIYIFPDDFPVNIANPADLTKLKSSLQARSSTSSRAVMSSKMPPVTAWSRSRTRSTR